MWFMVFFRFCITVIAVEIAIIKWSSYPQFLEYFILRWFSSRKHWTKFWLNNIFKDKSTQDNVLDLDFWKILTGLSNQAYDIQLWLPRSQMNRHKQCPTYYYGKFLLFHGWCLFFQKNQQVLLLRYLNIIKYIFIQIAPPYLIG